MHLTINTLELRKTYTVQSYQYINYYMGNYFILEIKKEGSDMIDKLVVIQGMDTLDGLYNYMEQIRKKRKGK